jgi:hypothetical protein
MQNTNKGNEKIYLLISSEVIPKIGAKSARDSIVKLGISSVHVALSEGFKGIQKVAASPANLPPNISVSNLSPIMHDLFG